MLSAALDFPKGKRITDHYSILAQEAVAFSQELPTSWAQLKYWTNGEIKFHKYNIYMLQRQILFLQTENV